MPDPGAPDPPPRPSTRRLLVTTAIGAAAFGLLYGIATAVVQGRFGAADLLGTILAAVVWGVLLLAFQLVRMRRSTR